MRLYDVDQVCDKCGFSPADGCRCDEVDDLQKMLADAEKRLSNCKGWFYKERADKEKAERERDNWQHKSAHNLERLEKAFIEKAHLKNRVDLAEKLADTLGPVYTRAPADQTTLALAAFLESRKQ